MKTANRFLIGMIVVLLLAGASLMIKERIAHDRDVKNYPTAYLELIDKYSKEYDLDPYMVLSVMRIESSFKPDAISNFGALGLMQIMPDTGAWIAHKLHMDDTYTEADLYKPDVNVRFGCWFLNFLKGRFNGYEKAMICAYNVGHGTLNKWLNNESYTRNGELIVIPNADVELYYSKYIKAYEKYRELYPDLFIEV